MARLRRALALLFVVACGGRTPLDDGSYVTTDGGGDAVDSGSPKQKTSNKLDMLFAIDNSAFEMSCTPGYSPTEGQGGAKDNGAFLGDFYSPGLYAFGDLIAEWRASGDLEGLELS